MQPKKYVPLVLAALWLPAAAPAAPASYAIDPAHTSVVFSVDHSGWARVYGMMRGIKGDVRFDSANLAATKVDVVIDAGSLFTNDAKRDEHLRSPDFFNVAEFPEIRFVSSSVQPTGARSARIIGAMTLLGVTRTVQLDAVFNAAAPDPITKVVKAGFSVRALIRRSEFGMKYALPRVGDEVPLILEVETIQR